jgi:hypothetical protein
VTFKETAFAVVGIPHRLARTKSRSTPAASAGPPNGPAGSRVSATRHGVTVKKDAAQLESIVTLFDPIALQLPCCTVTFNVTVPEAPAWNVMFRVPAPAVIVPFPIDHVYVAPAPASGTEAPWPPEFEQTEDGAVIVASGDVLMTAVVMATGDGQEFAVAITL